MLKRQISPDSDASDRLGLGEGERESFLPPGLGFTAEIFRYVTVRIISLLNILHATQH